MRNSKVYCLISVYSWFVIIFKFDIFLIQSWLVGGGGE